jgi:hypothetical protein
MCRHLVDFYKNNKKETWMIIMTVVIYSMYLGFEKMFFISELQRANIMAIEIKNIYNYDSCVGYYLKDTEIEDNFYIKECICKYYKIPNMKDLVCISIANVTDEINYYYIEFFPYGIRNTKTLDYDMYQRTKEAIIFTRNFSFVFLAIAYSYIIISFFIKICTMFYQLRTRIINNNIPQPRENPRHPLLEIVIINEENKNNYEGMCTICLEEFVITNKVFRHQCNNKFHKDCILQWMRVKDTCPLCKEKI